MLDGEVIQDETISQPANFGFITMCEELTKQNVDLNPKLIEKYSSIVGPKPRFDERDGLLILEPKVDGRITVVSDNQEEESLQKKIPFQHLAFDNGSHLKLPFDNTALIHKDSSAS